MTEIRSGFLLLSYLGMIKIVLGKSKWYSRNNRRCGLDRIVSPSLWKCVSFLEWW